MPRAKLIMISPTGIWNSKQNALYPGVIDSLQAVQAAGNTLLCISSRGRPHWYDSRFDFMVFHECGFKPPRKTGKIVRELVALNQSRGLSFSDIIVLGTNDDDFLMAVNSKSLLIRCEWAAPLPDKIARYGVPIKDPAELMKVVGLLSDEAPWHFSYQSDFLDVFALTQAGTLGEQDPKMVALANELRECLKNGHQTHHKALLLHCMSSLNSTPIFREAAVWGYYPSSTSANDGSEVMAGFCNGSREMFKVPSRGPLFIRHKPSVKRHLGSAERTNPTSQIETICINPQYKGKIEDKVVVILDDYLTYGTSFGVSGAFLRRAGAKKVVCVAMGKFGNTACLYDIELASGSTGDPYKPILPGNYNVKSITHMAGAHVVEAKMELKKKFGIN